MFKSNSIKDQKQHRYEKLYKRYFRSYCLVFFSVFICIILTVSTFMFFNFKNQLKEKIYQSATETTALLDYNFSSYINTISILSNNHHIVNFFHYTESLNNDFATSQNLSTCSNTLAEQSRLLNNTNELIVYNPTIDYFLSSTSSGFASDNKDLFWVKMISENNIKKIFIEKYDDFVYVISPQSTGYIILSFRQPFDEITEKFDSVYVYQTATEKLIYASDDNIIPISNSNQNMSFANYTLTMTSNCWFTYVYHAKLLSFNNLFSLLLAFAIIIILLIVVMLKVSMHQAKNTHSNIANVLTILNYDEDDQKSYDEWQYIANNILSLIEQNDDYTKKQAEYISELKSSHYVAMQNQLTPHFLFNTLSMITLSIQNTLRGDCDGTIMLTKLSELLRLMQKTSSNLIPVSSELEYTEKYIELEQMKHPNLKFNTDIEDDCLKYYMPKFSLQPILENSIIHGATPGKELVVNLSVSSYNNDFIEITISDNGCGMDSATLEKLQNMKNDMMNLEYSHNHIGFSNTVKRFNLMFTSDFDYYIKSDATGTKITFIIPKIII